MGRIRDVLWWKRSNQHSSSPRSASGGEVLSPTNTPLSPTNNTNATTETEGAEAVDNKENESPRATAKPFLRRSSNSDGALSSRSGSSRSRSSSSKSSKHNDNEDDEDSVEITSYGMDGQVKVTVASSPRNINSTNSNTNKETATLVTAPGSYKDTATQEDNINSVNDNAEEEDQDTFLSLTHQLSDEVFVALTTSTSTEYSSNSDATTTASSNGYGPSSVSEVTAFTEVSDDGVLRDDEGNPIDLNDCEENMLRDEEGNIIDPKTLVLREDELYEYYDESGEKIDHNSMIDHLECLGVVDVEDVNVDVPISCIAVDERGPLVDADDGIALVDADDGIAGREEGSRSDVIAEQGPSVAANVATSEPPTSSCASTIPCPLEMLVDSNVGTTGSEGESISSRSSSIAKSSPPAMAVESTNCNNGESGGEIPEPGTTSAMAVESANSEEESGSSTTTKQEPALLNADDCTQEEEGSGISDLQASPFLHEEPIICSLDHDDDGSEDERADDDTPSEDDDESDNSCCLREAPSHEEESFPSHETRGRQQQHNNNNNNTSSSHRRNKQRNRRSCPTSRPDQQCVHVMLNNNLSTLEEEEESSVVEVSKKKNSHSSNNNDGCGEDEFEYNELLSLKSSSSGSFEEKFIRARWEYSLHVISSGPCVTNQILIDARDEINSMLRPDDDCSIELETGEI